jgi:hypothetical protein
MGLDRLFESSVLTAALKCAVCALAAGANPHSAPRHRIAVVHNAERRGLFLPGDLLAYRSPDAAAWLSLEITWKFVEDETHEGSTADENGINENLLMKIAFNERRSNWMAMPANAS